MAHAHARLTFHGRCLLVRRVVLDGRPVNARREGTAKELGVSRQCAHRWVNRYRAEGWSGLQDRSGGPHRRPTRTPAAVERRVLKARRTLRRGPDALAEHTGVPARAVSRILRRHRMPPLAGCDPLTGRVIRATEPAADATNTPGPGS